MCIRYRILTSGNDNYRKMLSNIENNFRQKPLKLLNIIRFRIKIETSDNNTEFKYKLAKIFHVGARYSYFYLSRQKHLKSQMCRITYFYTHGAVIRIFQIQLQPNKCQNLYYKKLKIKHFFRGVQIHHLNSM